MIVLSSYTIDKFVALLQLTGDFFKRFKPLKQMHTPPRPGSTKSMSGRQSRQSRTSTPNSLEPPEPDIRPERLMGQSAEAMVDLRKHDRVVLSRSNMRNGVGLHSLNLLLEIKKNLSQFKNSEQFKSFTLLTFSFA